MNLQYAWHLLTLNPGLFAEGVISRLRACRHLPQRDMLKVGGVNVPYHQEYEGYLKSLYFGSRNIAIRHLMRRFLQPGGTLIDIGANIGCISVYGLSLVGTSGEVHAFEPVQVYVDCLEKLAAANPEHNLVVNPYGLGEMKDSKTIYISKTNIGFNTFHENLRDKLDPLCRRVEETVEIIDFASYVRQRNMRPVSLIKIDTEGYEFNVLRGFKGYFENVSERPPVICEIHTDVYDNAGNSLASFFEYMAGWDYQPYNIINSRKRIYPEELTSSRDILFLAG